MRVFLMWSGERSRLVADSLKDLIETVLQGVECFYSGDDIESGTRWQRALDASLAGCHFGVPCLTKENRDSTWMHFESGVLARGESATASGRICAYLIDMKPSDLPPPLGQFQNRTADTPGTWALISHLNSVRPENERTKEGAARRAFDALIHTHLAVVTGSAKAGCPALAAVAPTRSAEDMLREVLDLLRSERHERLGADPAELQRLQIPVANPLLMEELIRLEQLIAGLQDSDPGILTVPLFQKTERRVRELRAIVTHNPQLDLNFLRNDVRRLTKALRELYRVPPPQPSPRMEARDPESGPGAEDEH